MLLPGEAFGGMHYLILCMQIRFDGLLVSQAIILCCSEVCVEQCQARDSTYTWLGGGPFLCVNQSDCDVAPVLFLVC